MMMRMRLSGPGLAALAILLGMLASSLPAAAQTLDPRVAGPLQALFQRAAMLCQSGNPMACQEAQQLQQAGAQLSQAQQACQAGNPQACAFFQNGAQQIGVAYQQMQMQAGGGYPQGGGQGYSQQQMTQDHQRRMQQQQMQFQQQQQNYQRQQQQNDEQHRRFMEQLRR
jgi:hypothetical protein